MDKAFTYWPTSPTPIFREPRWAVGKWGPRMIIQGEEEDIKQVVDALNFVENIK